MTIIIQNNYYFLRYIVAGHFFNDDSQIFRGYERYVISQLSGNHFVIDYTSDLFAPVLWNLLVSKERSKKGS